MTSILVGVDGTRRGDRAVAWAARQAEREGASLALLSVIDSDMVRTFGVASDAVRDAVQSVLDETAQSVAAQHPDLEIKTTIVEGEVVSSMANAANLHDMIVLGSHHGATIGETMGGAKGLRVSVLTKVPTVVVPADWDLDTENEGVMVGVGPDNVSENAIAFGIRQAEMLNQELDLVSAWGLPPLLTRPAEVMGGGLGPVGEQFQAELDVRVAKIKAAHPDLDIEGHSIEGPSPARVLIDHSKSFGMLVMGTHSRTMLGRTVFGSVTHSVLMNMAVPTVIVPQK